MVDNITGQHTDEGQSEILDALHATIKYIINTTMVYMIYMFTYICSIKEREGYGTIFPLSNLRVICTII